MKKVVILIISHKATLSDYEKISLQQCYRILGQYDIFFICPHGIDTSAYRTILPEPRFHFIDARWQSTYANFNRLKIDRFLYQHYANYEYILFYEPDAFVFRDELLHWCNEGYDYIGAPWFKNFSNDERDDTFMQGGNGGFSLRKVSSHLKVLRRFGYVVPFQENFVFRIGEKSRFIEYAKGAVHLALDYTIFNNTYWAMNTFFGNEDQFWSLYAPRAHRWFKVASAQEAMYFSFEMQPKRLFDWTNGTVPFGCHAWWKYDLSFWKPLIESYGYVL